MLKKIEISHRTIIFTVVFLLALWFLYFVRDIIFSLFVALLFMAILNPVVSRFTKWKIPRVFSVILTYILVLGVFGLVIAWVIPPLIEQTTNFANNIRYFFEDLGWGSYYEGQLNQTLSQLGSLPSQAFKFGVSIFSNILGVISVLIFAFYFLLYRGKLDKQLGFFFGEDKKGKAGKVIDEIEVKLGGWARGQITLMSIVGTITYIGLILLGIPFALPLAILAGLFEIVPILGPIIAGIPAVIIALSVSPLMALATAALAFLIQQIENYFLVPRIMKKSVGVNPLVTLLALTIGYRLIGIAGALLAVPLFLTIQILVREYFKGK